jgi:4-hydroxyphenylacetate 3-monooxygenase
MLRTGDQYRQSIRDGRQVGINGEKVADVTKHPAQRSIVDIRARIDDMVHEQGSKEIMSYRDAATGEESNIGYKLPHSRTFGMPNAMPSIPS